MVDATERVNRYLRLHAEGKVEPDSMLEKLCLFWRWAPHCCEIRTADQRDAKLKPNVGQTILMATAMDMAAEDLPVRIKNGKARKLGSSTLWQALGVFLCAHYPNQVAATLAHEHRATESIFNIARRAAFGSGLVDTEVRSVLRFPATQSEYSCQTAGATGVQAGGTPSFLHRSEIPLWEQRKEETLHKSQIAVPHHPSTIIVDESTFKGRDQFWESFDAARGGQSAWRAVFLPWFLDTTLWVAPDMPFSRSAEERTIAEQASEYGIELTDGALQWRRTMLDDPDIGEFVFRQEYPATPEEAVQAAKGLILPGVRGLLVDDLPFDPLNAINQERFGGIDHGYHDACVIWSAVWRDQTLWVYDYWRGTETLASEQVNGLNTGTTYYCDPSGVSDRKHLERASYELGQFCKFIPAPRRKNPGEDPGVTELQTLVRFADAGRLKIKRSIAKQLLAECDSYSWDEAKGKPNEKRGQAWGHYDSIMALKYMVMGIAPRIGKSHVEVVTEGRLNRWKEWSSV